MPYFRPNPEAIRAIHAYSGRFYTDTLPVTLPTENYVASPFGSWLLLAVLAGSTDFSGVPENEAAVVDILGLPIDDAATAAEEFLVNLDGADLGIGAWFDPGFALKAPRIASWLKANTLGTTEDRIPSQKEMDEWTSEATHGLITEFPLEIKPELMFLVASVVYTKFEWRTPYDVVDSATHAGLASWDVDKALFTSTAGINFWRNGNVVFASHVNTSDGGQQVTSFVVVSGEVDDLGLLALAHSTHDRHSSTERVSYYDAATLILDANATVVFDEKLHENRSSAVLPAWEADNTHDLELPSFGYEAISETLIIGYPDEYDGFKAKQSVVAKYGAKGFEAAAVTAFGMMRASAAMPMNGAHRATVAFDRPFVALCTINFIPVFSAVIRKATEA